MLAVSIRFTPRSTTRRTSCLAVSRSRTPSALRAPEMRIAPNPSRRTVSSPPMVKVPTASSESVLSAIGKIGYYYLTPVPRGRRESNELPTPDERQLVEPDLPAVLAELDPGGEP